MHTTKTLFLDIGGVLLTNGWDRNSRNECVIKFNLDKEEFEDRHHLVFSTYELGKLTLDDYLYHLLFYKKQEFSREEFKDFMFAQSQPIDDAIDYFKELKKIKGLKVVAVSNEAKELNDYRIEKFQLNDLFDFYISSCYVHLRKPDPEIFTLACDASQTLPENALFIDDRLLYIEIAAKLGISGYHFQNIIETKKFLECYNY